MMGAFDGLLWLLLVASASLQTGATLYGVVTEFTLTETLLWTVEFDGFGNVRNVTEDVVYAGASATVDGISTFDKTGQRYFWATDFESTFVYSVDVKRKQFLPPLDVGASSIISLNYDAVKQRLLVLFEGRNAIYLGEYGVGTFRIVFQLPTQFNSHYIMTSSLDELRQRYYLVADVGSTPKYEVAVFDLMTGKLLSQVPLDNTTCGDFYPQYFFFDPASGNLLGAAEEFANSKIYYFYTVLNPTRGTCVKTALAIPTGIVTCWTYDPKNSLLYLADATDSGAFLLNYNTKTRTMSSPLLVKGYLVPESLEVNV